MTKTLALIGAGDHGNVVYDGAITMDCWDKIEIYDDAGLDKSYHLDVIGTVSDLIDEKKNPLLTKVFVAIGDNRKRETTIERVLSAGFNLTNINCLSAFVSSRSYVGLGSVVMPNSVVNANARLGRACIVNSGSIVEHDCQIGEFVHICPRAVLAGRVSVGDYSFIGVGSTVRNGIRIGRGAYIGAGTVVVADVPDHSLVFGCPGKVIERDYTADPKGIG